nr:hypothetical protein GCM10025732_46170 [Glycomyces mayteni]
MKSVGEAMSLGRTFQQALQKALRSTETKAAGFWTRPDPAGATLENTLEALRTAHDGTLYTAERALRLGATVAEVHDACKIDPWFLDQVAQLIELRDEIEAAAVADAALLRRAKRAGFSDAQIAALRPELAGEDGVRRLRHRLGMRPVYKTVDTCAAEFEAHTPYHYSTYEEETEVAPSNRPKVMILGSGPNRIGQGIEFDYSCVHAVQALRAVGYETIMVNCNPETVSTDYDTADRLYFEPLTFEDVTEVFHAEHESGRAAPEAPASSASSSSSAARPPRPRRAPPGRRTAHRRHLAQGHRQRRGPRRLRAAPRRPRPRRPRRRHRHLLRGGPRGRRAHRLPRARAPSYVLGGRGMEIVYDEDTLAGYISRATEASPEHPVLIDRFLDDAIEIDVDCLCDGEDFYLGGIMEHIEEAGVHSGDSSCALPPITLGARVIEQIRDYTAKLAFGIGVRGLMNVQYALKDEQLYVLEANPRASRTVPFVSKATAVPLAKAAARIALGAKIGELRAEGMLLPEGDGSDAGPEVPISVKEVLLPFKRFRTVEGSGIDAVLGPEMKSTGEVMGIDSSFGLAFAKATLAVYGKLPTSGNVFVSVADRDKRAIVFPVRRLVDLGFTVYATEGTGLVLKRHGIDFTPVARHSSGEAVDAVSLIASGEVDLVITTPSASRARAPTAGRSAPPPSSPT